MITFLKKEFSHSNAKSKDLIISYGILGIFGFIIFYFLNHNISINQNYENLNLRIVSAFLSFGMVIHRYWPQQMKRYLFPLWNLTLLFNIPFFFTFMLLKNYESNIWSLHWVLALTLLMILVNLIPFIILTILGVSIAIICYILSTSFPHLPDNLGGLLAAYVSFTLYYIFIFQKQRGSDAEKLKKMSLLAGSIAHEMRTPLLGIGAVGVGLEKTMPTLLASYEYASQANLTNFKPLSSPQLHFLPDLPQKIQKATQDAFVTIDMLLMNLKENFQDTRIEHCSIHQCITEALEQYPLDPREKKLIIFDKGPDFYFLGNSIFIRHIFFNLLKNSLFYVKKAGKGNITIHISTEKNSNVVFFKDTGPGIDKKSLARIFDQFYTKTAHGAGIGLAFCKKIMEDLGGDITCTSIVDEFTEFKIKFPKLSNRLQKEKK